MALSEQQAQQEISEIWHDPKYKATKKNIERAILAKDDSKLTQLIDTLLNMLLGAPKEFAHLIKLLLAWAQSTTKKS
ncbi:MAG: hypothetical protein Q8N96_11660 [Methylovulum sp.]|nr:hypothetical protein [Methylovulum sp.]